MKKPIELPEGLRLPIMFKEINGKQYMQTIPFRPGTVIKRNGKMYRVDAKGTQRIVHE